MHNLHGLCISKFLFYSITAKHKVKKSSQNNANVYIHEVLKAKKQGSVSGWTYRVGVLDTHKKHRETCIYYEYVLEQKNNCEPLQDISTQDIMKVHLLCNTSATGSKKQCLLVGLLTVPFQILCTFFKAGVNHQNTTLFSLLSGTIQFFWKWQQCLSCSVIIKGFQLGRPNHLHAFPQLIIRSDNLILYALKH